MVLDGAAVAVLSDITVLDSGSNLGRANGNGRGHRQDVFEMHNEEDCGVKGNVMVQMACGWKEDNVEANRARLIDNLEQPRPQILRRLPLLTRATGPKAKSQGHS